jgi:crotonobetainyl-CoA:carnitine CoA-transferase CaiB-like acyl-CoA transferase
LVFELQGANIPYGIVKDMQGVFDTSEAQGLLLHSADRIGVRTYVGGPFRDGSSHFLPPPHLGEHSREILIQTLAMATQEVQTLINAGIIL